MGYVRGRARKWSEKVDIGVWAALARVDTFDAEDRGVRIGSL